jgi:transaldolase
MTNPKDLKKAEIIGDDLVITIPVDLLKHAFNNKEDNYDQFSIKDKKAFAEYVAKNILDFGGDSETGLSEFEIMIDALFEEIVESGQDFIEELDGPF